jgi:hypothetical protein
VPAPLIPATTKPLADVPLVYEDPDGVPFATFDQLELSAEYCHWYVKDGVPPDAAIDIAAVVPPAQIADGAVGLDVMEGLSETVSVVVAVDVHPPLLICHCKV